MNAEAWPPLPLAGWLPTYKTLHMWTQIVGKIRMTMSAPLNHWWNVTLYVNARGLTTGPIPCASGVFEIEFDFDHHVLRISASAGAAVEHALRSESVAEFYAAVFQSLREMGIDVAINPKPQEIADPVPFDRDDSNCTYDPDAANRLWHILLSSARVFERFRAKFIGKCSPVHFFWGSFDLAVTRFSGRPAPPRKGVISGPAYSHEVSSAGFWPGGGIIDGPAFYAYFVPKPAGLENQPVRPAAAHWHPQLSEFILMYDDVRTAASPDGALFEFLQSTYAAGARLADWSHDLEIP